MRGCVFIMRRFVEFVGLDLVDGCIKITTAICPGPTTMRAQVAMSNKALKTKLRPELRQLAQQIVKAQMREQGQLRGWNAAWSKP